MGVLEWVPAVYVLAALSYAALLDFRFREVPPRYWVLVGVPGALVSIPINVLGYDFKVLAVYYLVSLIVVAVVYFMYRFCMMGGADVLALALISVLTPIRPGSFMPLIYLTILYSVIPALAYQVYSGFKACGSLDFKCAARLKYRVKAGRLLSDEGFKWWL
ncbi:MAG: prepilin peptidase, partial [Acidilobaceae archaeon]